MDHDLLSGTAFSEGDAALDDLIDQVAQQCRLGQDVDLEELVASNPQYESALRQIVPTIAALEASGPRDAQHRAGAPAADKPSLPAEKQIGEFRLIREIGRGGMGIVYEAEQLSLGRRVALKVFPMAGLLDERQLQRFKNEARAAASLHHGNIVPVYSVGSDQGVHFYAMQFIQGQTVAQLVCQTVQEPKTFRPSVKHADMRRSVGPLLQKTPLSDSADATIIADDAVAARLPVSAEVDTDAVAIATVASIRTAAHFRMVAELGIQVAEALQYAHSLGIVHRDIKPSNLLLDAGGKVWVADFGLAQIEADAGMTMTGDLIGTARYMSPEQALGRPGQTDSRTDIYSLGITFMNCSSGGPLMGTLTVNGCCKRCSSRNRRHRAKSTRRSPATWRR